jgi:hypothetical protein
MVLTDNYLTRVAEGAPERDNWSGQGPRQHRRAALVQQCARHGVAEFEGLAPTSVRPVLQSCMEDCFDQTSSVRDLGCRT